MRDIQNNVVWELDAWEFNREREDCMLLGVDLGMMGKTWTRRDKAWSLVEDEDGWVVLGFIGFFG